ncbi:rRNA-processing protein cgr1 [Lithohypha guttulata]|uniref:rRNA-processing protein n=1 Tax=Lithohypha guttulata TaxID=1690604 RepID=A0AAN7YJA0_9EURO|nr:rRNA-processing protein cgr1 [Lithohypha guttulata]
MTTVEDTQSQPVAMEFAKATTVSTSAPAGIRVNGKNWHAQKKAFRPTAGLTSFQKRMEMEQVKKATKAKEQEMKDEKEQERNSRIQAIKDRRKAKEEKERYDKMAEKMHKKIVERRKRREKRNKLLNS